MRLMNTSEVVQLLRDALDARDAEIARLREVLRFYADDDNWNQPDGDAPVLIDDGNRARTALNGGDDEG